MKKFLIQCEVKNPTTLLSDGTVSGHKTLTEDRAVLVPLSKSLSVLFIGEEFHTQSPTAILELMKVKTSSVVPAEEVDMDTDTEAEAEAEVTVEEKGQDKKQEESTDFYLDEQFSDLTNKMDILVGNSIIPVNVLLVGPPSTGKSSFVRLWAKKKSQKLFQLSLNRDIDASILLGHWELKNHETIYAYGILAQAMKTGGVLLLDEWDSQSPEAGQILQQILEERTLVIPDTGEVLVNKNLIVFGTANTIGGEDLEGVYAGVVRQNLAQLDRFIVINIEYKNITEKVETKIGKPLPAEVRDWLQYLTGLWNTTTPPKCHPISIRTILQAWVLSNEDAMEFKRRLKELATMKAVGEDRAILEQIFNRL